MKNGSKTNGHANSDLILKYLPVDRQKAIVNEAARSMIEAEAHASASFGEFIDRLRKHEQWEILRAQPLAFRVVTSTDKNEVVSSNSRPQTLDSEVPAAASFGRVRRVDEAVVERVFKLVKANPGRRSEELQRLAASFDRPTVKGALAKLRATARVKTRGLKRATTYVALK